MRKSRNSWPPARTFSKGLLMAALALLLACEGNTQSRPRRPAKKRAPAPMPLALTVDTVSFQLLQMTWFVLPGQTLALSAGLAPAMAEVGATATEGRLDALSPGAWRYTAPARPGQDVVEFRQKDGHAQASLRICVLIPEDQVKKGSINGYKIGTYITGHPNPIYSPPAGYFEVLGKNADEWLTPHVKMRDVVTKQINEYPRYLVLNPRLLIKLEAALAAAQKAGVKVRRFSFVSGYRTPYYNAKIENVGLSRHQYGDAADVFVDNDGDGYMDDLNHDGALDIHDAEYLAAIVDKMDRRGPHADLSGGLGIYRPKPGRTAFIHMDTRGYKARWVN